MKQQQRDAQIKTILLISTLTFIIISLFTILEDTKTYHIYNITLNQNNTIIQNKSDDCLTTCQDIFRKVGCQNCNGVQPQGQDWFYYPDDCIKYCEKKNK